MTLNLVGVKDDANLWRGPRPESYKEMSVLKSYGVRTIINLEVGWFDFFHGRRNEEIEWCEEFDISIAHLPLSDFHVPTERQIRAFLFCVDNALNNGNVYFHCLHGVDRTGFMAAIYRIRVRHWSREIAIAEMLDLGFHKFPYWFWIKALK